ncbi:hypothetical protein FE236_13190 [Mariprofundus erugo]|uniref:hypothetical protein n=1 Tax=Mariprofundus erugo TaxID=2528639 RepID=UPI0010FD1F27|nr:hypothetical protein [Mariprofundus erugo]TLS73509.1 hypothetical protein FE236_13190 [Mariprofundus erugo]
MYMHESRQSRNILIQLAVTTLLVMVLGIYFSDVLGMIYFSNQQTSAGFALNGLILGLFMLGLIRILALLLSYHGEEESLARFHNNLQQRRQDLLEGVSPASIIARRMDLLEGMSIRHAEIHHQALAATLLAHESTRTALIRFIHNILILCGVLGTIISLSIALVGASSLLEQAVSSTGMGMVIHGMSTALSTTMTAVLCYLFLTYFFSAVQNLQTRLLGHIEQLTTTRLLPMFQVTEEAVTGQALDLVREAHQLVQSVHESIDALDLASLREGIDQAAEQSRAQHEALLEELRMLSSVLKDGFRLPKE